MMDANNLIESLRRIQAELPNAINKALDNISEIAVTNAKSSTLFKGNGPLRKTIAFKKSGEYAREVMAPAPYAAYVEFGNNQNGPIIRPKNAKALRFRINGKIVFRKWVRAHGPLPFMNNARIHAMKFIPDFFNIEIDRIIK